MSPVNRRMQDWSCFVGKTNVVSELQHTHKRCAMDQSGSNLCLIKRDFWLSRRPTAMVIWGQLIRLGHPNHIRVDVDRQLSDLAGRFSARAVKTQTDSESRRTRSATRRTGDR